MDKTFLTFLSLFASSLILMGLIYQENEQEV